MDSWTLSDVSTLNDKTYNEIEISNIKLSISVLKAMQPTTHEAAQRQMGILSLSANDRWQNWGQATPHH